MDIEVNVAEGKGVRRILEVRVPAENVDSEFRMAMQEVRNEVKIHGFRPGKAPAQVVAAKYGTEISRTVMEKMLPEAFREALKKVDIDPVGEPELKDVKLKRGEPLTFNAIIDVAPKVKPTGYTGLKLKRRVIEVPDESVQRRIKSLRESLAEIQDVKRPAAKTDIVSAFLTKLQGEDNVGPEENLGMVDLHIDEEKLLLEFVDNLTGKEVGDEVEFSVKYPADYFEKKLANYTFRYRAEVKRIREMKLPESDAEVIEKLGIKDKDGNPAPPEKLAEFVRNDIERRVENDIRRDLENQAVRLVAENNQFDVPESVLDRCLEGMIEDYKQGHKSFNEDGLREDLRPMADELVRWFYIRDALIEEKGFKVDNDEMTQYRERMSQQGDQGEEQADKESIEERLDRIKDQLLERKVLDLIIESADIEDIKHDPENREDQENRDSIIITPDSKDGKDGTRNRIIVAPNAKSAETDGETEGPEKKKSIIITPEER